MKQIPLLPIQRFLPGMVSNLSRRQGKRGAKAVRSLCEACPKGAATLLEILIATAIISFILIAVVQIYIKGIAVFQAARDANILQTEATNLLQELTNGEYGLLGAKAVQTAQTAEIIFTGSANQTIRYFLTGSCLLRDVGTDTDKRFFDFNEQAEVEQLEFRYYDNTNTLLSLPVANPARITKVKMLINLGLKDEDKSLNLTGAVKLRNVCPL